jgi:hypothetical protein
MLAGEGTGTWTQRLERIASGRFARDFGELPGVLAGGLDGGLLYQRFVGEQMVPVVPYASAALLIVIGWRLLRGPRPARRELALLAFGVLLADLIVVLTPGLSLRYFLFLFLFAPLLLAALAAPLLADPRLRRAAQALLGCVVALNLGYLTLDYFVAFARTGGTPSVFPLGKRQLETSNHFLRSDRLYAQLVARGVGTLLAKEFIVLPLSAYDREARALRFVDLPPGRTPEPGALPPADGRRLAAVFYAGPEVYLNRAWDPPQGETLEIGSATLRRDDSFDPHYLVFVSEGAR